MTLYDPVTNEPYVPTPLDDARESLASARRWAARADDPLPPETARQLVGFWAAEVARLALAEREAFGTSPSAMERTALVSRSASVSGNRLARDEAA